MKTNQASSNRSSYDEKIHNTAIISENAVLGENVKIGPYSIVGDNVHIGNNVEIKSHVVIEGETYIGDDTVIYPFASIGAVPQNKKEYDKGSKVKIGKNNTIREYVTIQPGIEGFGLETIVGDNCLLMLGVHIAHDCKVGNNCLLANQATLAGHVVLEDNVRLGGLVAIHQHVRIGEHAMVGGMSGVENDVIPYGVVYGERAFLRGIHIVGLKRSGVLNDDIRVIMNIYDEVFSDIKNELNFTSNVKICKEKYKNNEKALKLLDFILSPGKRGLCKPKHNNNHECGMQI